VTGDHPGEVVVGFSRDRKQIADATYFRSTWLTSSIASLRESGLGARYEHELTGAHRDTVLSAVPGVWLPMDVAIAHYSACDRLELETSVLVALGEGAVRRAHGTSLGFAVRMARGAGTTPWTLLSQVSRFWEHTCKGGEVGIFKLGPKDARIEHVGFPLARIKYNRVTMRGIISGMLGLFCERLYVHEIRELCTERSLGFRVSWA
jgi:hypothetical protein